MSGQNTMGNYMDSIGGSSLAAAQAESRRMAQKLEDERVAEAQDAKRKRDLKSIADHKAAQEKADAEKRAKLQAETDAIIQAQNEAEKARAQKEWRGAVGSLEGFDAWWSSTTADRATAKMRDRMRDVPSARDVLDGNIGPRAKFTPVRFPN